MNNILPTPYQQFIHKSRYARWLDDEQRRENWDETVERYLQFIERSQFHTSKPESVVLTSTNAR